MKYAHVCYRINEIDRSIEFYCGALGFKELKRYHIRDEAVNIYVAPEGSEHAPLELTFNFGRTEDYDIGTGYGHIAYHVDDLDGTLARLAADGVALQFLEAEGAAIELDRAVDLVDAIADVGVFHAPSVATQSAATPRPAWKAASSSSAIAYVWRSLGKARARTSLT